MMRMGDADVELALGRPVDAATIGSQPTMETRLAASLRHRRFGVAAAAVLRCFCRCGWKERIGKRLAVFRTEPNLPPSLNFDDFSPSSTLNSSFLFVFLFFFRLNPPDGFFFASPLSSVPSFTLGVEQRGLATDYLSIHPQIRNKKRKKREIDH